MSACCDANHNSCCYAFPATSSSIDAEQIEELLVKVPVVDIIWPQVQRDMPCVSYHYYNTDRKMVETRHMDSRYPTDRVTTVETHRRMSLNANNGVGYV